MPIKLSTKIARIVGYYLSGPLIILALLIASQFDYEAEEQLLLDYCQNVAAYVWPDYKEIYKEKCPSVLDEAETKN